VKDKHVIKISNSRLRKIRNEFRLLWHTVLSSRLHKVNDELEKMKFDDTDGHRILIDERNPENLKYYRSLQSVKAELRESIRMSICECASCGRADRDMYYNKTYNAWWCTDCAGLFKTMHPHMKENYANKDPRFYDYDEEFGKSFL
jgi:hypothetical protein